jgi:hypothetical protein
MYSMRAILRGLLEVTATLNLKYLSFIRPVPFYRSILHLQQAMKIVLPN